MKAEELATILFSIPPLATLGLAFAVRTRKPTALKRAGRFAVLTVPVALVSGAWLCRGMPDAAVGILALTVWTPIGFSVAMIMAIFSRP
jgi:hypothetical protein